MKLNTLCEIEKTAAPAFVGKLLSKLMPAAAPVAKKSSMLKYLLPALGIGGVGAYAATHPEQLGEIGANLQNEYENFDWDNVQNAFRGGQQESDLNANTWSPHAEGEEPGMLKTIMNLLGGAAGDVSESLVSMPTYSEGIARGLGNLYGNIENFPELVQKGYGKESAQNSLLNDYMDLPGTHRNPTEAQIGSFNQRLR